MRTTINTPPATLPATAAMLLAGAGCDVGIPIHSQYNIKLFETIPYVDTPVELGQDARDQSCCMWQSFHELVRTQDHT